MSDDFEKRRQSAVREAISRGVKPRDVDPPLDRLLRRFGFRIRPPYYRSFAANTGFLGTFFGVIWGIVMWLFVWSGRGIAPGAAVILSASAGLLFGVLMASFIKWKKRKVGLSEWDDLPL